MSAASPWLKFYPRDWRSDEKLRLCSLAARGLWIEMLALMHASEKYGRLLVAGKPPTTARLAIQVGASEAEVEVLLDELREADVFSVDASGTIYSRRMKKDEKSAEIARKNGKRGGNPKLCNSDGNSGADNQQDKGADKGGDKLRGQKPESREGSKALPSSTPPAPPKLPADLQAVMDEAGLVAPPDRRVLQGWYDQGADLEQDILPVIRKVLAREQERGAPRPTSLKYYDGPIREKLAEDQRESEAAQRNIRRWERIAAEEAAERQTAAGGA